DQRQESPEGDQVSDGRERSYIALQERLDIGAEPKRGSSWSGQYFGIPPVEQPYLAGLRGGHRPELEHRGTASHRFGDASHQPGLLRPRQVPSSRPAGSSIDPATNEGEHFRDV